MPNTTTETKRLTKSEKTIAQLLAVAGRRMARGKLTDAADVIREASQVCAARREKDYWKRDRPSLLVDAFERLLRAHPDYIASKLRRYAYREDLIASEGDSMPDDLASVMHTAYVLGKRTRAHLDALREQPVTAYDPDYLRLALDKAFDLGFSFSE